MCVAAFITSGAEAAAVQSMSAAMLHPQFAHRHLPMELACKLLVEMLAALLGVLPAILATIIVADAVLAAGRTLMIIGTRPIALLEEAFDTKFDSLTLFRRQAAALALPGFAARLIAIIIVSGCAARAARAVIVTIIRTSSTAFRTPVVITIASALSIALPLTRAGALIIHRTRLRPRLSAHKPQSYCHNSHAEQASHRRPFPVDWSVVLNPARRTTQAPVILPVPPLNWAEPFRQ